MEHLSLFFVRRTWRGGCFFTGDSERHVREGLEEEHLSLYRGSVRGTWRGGFFTGDSERHVREGLDGKHVSLYRGSVRGTWRGVPILRTARDM
jgi:hypothetical protein